MLTGIAILRGAIREPIMSFAWSAARVVVIVALGTERRLISVGRAPAAPADGRTPVEAVAGMSMVQPAGRDLGGEPSPLGGRFYDPMHSTGIERPSLAGHEHGRIRRGLTKA